MQEYRNPFHDIGTFFRSGSALSVLILVNAAVWIVISIIRVPLFLTRVPDNSVSDFIMNFLAVPANLTTLAHRPWTALTYMFLHLDFLHILFNMLWLFWFGKIFLEFLSSRKLVFAYFAGGVSGAVLYIAFFNIFPVFDVHRDTSFALGASAAVMAIVSTISFYVPTYSVNFIFIGKIRIIFIFMVLFVLDFFMIRSENSGGHIAHIGGALFGILYATSIRNGFNLKELTDVFRGKRFRKVKSIDPGKARSYSAWKERPARHLNDEDYNILKAEKQKKIDDILDKIARSGYESLTKVEKEFLFKESQK